MKINILEESDISPLERLLIDEQGLVRTLPFSTLNEFSQAELSQFCHKHAIYQLPTTELIEFLRKEIAEFNTIEIGAGNGCIGRYLGIKMTDNRMQTRPEIKLLYKTMGQPTINYGEDVENLDAIKAVEKYYPEVVVACWVTHMWKPGMNAGNKWGVEEELLFQNGVKKYIHVGNEDTHQDKPILLKNYPHKKFKFPWLLSRSMGREKNVIYVFEM